MEGCLCRLKQNVTYARAVAQQGLGIALAKCDVYNVWGQTECLECDVCKNGL